MHEICRWKYVVEVGLKSQVAYCKSLAKTCNFISVSSMNEWQSNRRIPATSWTTCQNSWYPVHTFCRNVPHQPFGKEELRLFGKQYNKTHIYTTNHCEGLLWRSLQLNSEKVSSGKCSYGPIWRNSPISEVHFLWYRTSLLCLRAQLSVISTAAISAFLFMQLL